MMMKKIEGRKWRKSEILKEIVMKIYKDSVKAVGRLPPPASNCNLYLVQFVVWNFSSWLRWWWRLFFLLNSFLLMSRERFSHMRREKLRCRRPDVTITIIEIRGAEQGAMEYKKSSWWSSGDGTESIIKEGGGGFGSKEWRLQGPKSKRMMIAMLEPTDCNKKIADYNNITRLGGLGPS